MDKKTPIEIKKNLNLPCYSDFQPKLAELLSCLEDCIFNYYQVETLEKYNESRKKFELSFSIDICDIYPKEYHGSNEIDKIENGAICLTFGLMPLLESYDEVILYEIGSGADYLFISSKTCFVVEVKGTTQEEYDSVVSEAKTQVFTSFDVYDFFNIEYGYASLSNFHIKKQIIIKYSNKPVGKEIDMDEIEIQKKITNLIFNAKTESQSGNLEKSKELYREAAKIQLESSKKVQKGLAKIFLLSAANCAIKAGEYSQAVLIIKELERNYSDILNESHKEEISKIKVIISTHRDNDNDYLIDKSDLFQLLHYLIIKNYEKFHQIRGYGNIIKMAVECQREFSLYGRVYDLEPVGAHDPIYTVKIKRILDQYQENELFEERSNLIFVTEKGKRFFNQSISEFEANLRNKLSPEIVSFIDEIVIKYGDKKVDEMRIIEQRDFNISKRTFYKKPIK